MDSLSSQVLFENWLTAWRKSAQHDHHLKLVVKEEYLSHEDALTHNHGWGVVGLGAIPGTETPNTFSTHSLVTYKTLRSLAQTPHVEMVQVVTTPNFLQSPQQVLLAHVRKASPSMPITFDQVHPMIIAPTSRSDFLAFGHNGGVSKSIINSMLSPPYKVDSEHVQSFSDTQLLALLFQQELEALKSKDDLFNSLWVPLLRKIRKAHESLGKKYSMMLLILHNYDSRIEYTVVHDFSDAISYKQPYYQLYELRSKDSFVICSSTVKEYYEQDYGLTNWTVKALPNHAILHFSGKDNVLELVEP